MKALSGYNSSNLNDLLDYDIVDQAGDSIGTVHSMWAQPSSGQLEFVGAKTGWIFGSNHVIPAEKAQIDEATRTIKVPYAMDLIKNAPTIDADATISDEQEDEIYRYYSLSRSNAGADAPVARTNSMTASASTVTKAAADGKGDIEMALSEEQVKVGTRTVDAGSVRLRKIIRTEIVNQPVEVRHEEVVVERVSADQVRAGTTTSDFKDETIDVPLTREEVVVSKEAHVTGAVRLHKTAETETQNVSETVRKEDVEVLRDGKAVADRAGR